MVGAEKALPVPACEEAALHQGPVWTRRRSSKSEIQGDVAESFPSQEGVQHADRVILVRLEYGLPCPGLSALK